MTASDSRFLTVLKKICRDPAIETEWLDMLSQLEYAGCRKIVKGVPFEKVNLEVLHHVMEEASHAFLLKSLVEKERNSLVAQAQSELSELGWRYFQSVDQQVCQLQGDGFHYPAVSWVVEQRVLVMYPQYAAATSNQSVKRVLARILAQEKRHGAQFDALDFPPQFKSAALECEQTLWDDFVEDLSGWVECQSPNRSASFGAALSSAL